MVGNVHGEKTMVMFWQGVIVDCFGEVKGSRNGGLAVLATNEIKH